MKDLFNTLKGSISDTVDKVTKNDNSIASVIAPGAIGGLVGALLGGSKSVKNAAKNIAYVGGGAVAATLAYNIFQKWRNGNTETASQQNQTQTTQNSNQQQVFNQSNSSQSLFDEFNQKNAPTQNNLGYKDTSVIIEALIFAARADGHIDKDEQNIILKISNELTNSNNVNSIIKDALNKELDTNYLASKIYSYEDAKDLYKLSATAIVSDTQEEMMYLERLASSLKIDRATKDALDREAALLKSQM